jgi:hypothetical protein
LELSSSYTATLLHRDRRPLSHVLLSALLLWWIEKLRGEKEIEGVVE